MAGYGYLRIEARLIGNLVYSDYEKQRRALPQHGAHTAEYAINRDINHVEITTCRPAVRLRSASLG